MLDDAGIRGALSTRLGRAERSRTALVLDELGIDHGRQRADLVVVNGRMTGYEIKSDRDSLDRLKKQVVGYDRVFDLSIVVTTERHLPSVLTTVPAWWGIWLSSLDPRGGIRFRIVRGPTRSPGVSKIALARLLWRDELLSVLGQMGVRQKRLRVGRDALHRILAGRVPLARLSMVVRRALKARSGWRDHGPLSPDGGWSPRNARS